MGRPVYGRTYPVPWKLILALLVPQSHAILDELPLMLRHELACAMNAGLFSQALTPHHTCAVSFLPPFIPLLSYLPSSIFFSTSFAPASFLFYLYLRSFL